jgi:hypothetical protein
VGRRAAILKEVALPVPEHVERRVRMKWSRRAKLKGYAIIALLAVTGILSLAWTRSHIGLFFIWSGAIAAAVRHVRVGRALAGDGEVDVEDEDAWKLQADLEQQIRIEGQREVAQGSLSVSTTADNEGALSPTDE